MSAFVAAVEMGSMDAAADALGLTQSAVSKRVGSLERRIGVALLERGRTGVCPTDAGRALYPEAKEALAALTRAAAAADAAREQGRQALRLVASHTIGAFLLPGWLAGFRAADRSPALRTEIGIVNSPRVLAAVRDGEAAIGFVEGVDPLDGFEVRPLMRDRLVVVVGPNHRWSRRRTVLVEELARERYYARERDSGARAVVTSALRRHGVQLDAALETPSIEALKRAVRVDGFTMLSTLAVKAEVRDGALTSLRVEGVELERDLRAIRCRRSDTRAASHRFWNMLPALQRR